MLELFKNNRIYTAVFVLLYGLPFFFAPLFGGSGADVTEAEAYPTLLRFIPSLTGLGTGFSALLFGALLLISAFWVNNVININRLGKRATFFASIALLLCTFLLPQSAALSPSFLASFALLASLLQFFRAYDKKNSVLEVFNAAFFAGLSGLLYPPGIWFGLFALFAWFILRTFNAKELIILLVGFLLPYYLCATYMYLNDRLLDWWSKEVAGSGFRPDFAFADSLALRISGVLFLLFLLLALFNLRALKYKTTIREQKFIDVLLLFLLISCLTWIGQKRFGPEDVAVIVLPMSIFLSLNLQAFKNEQIAEFLHLICYAAALFACYGNLIL